MLPRVHDSDGIISFALAQGAKNRCGIALPHADRECAQFYGKKAVAMGKEPPPLALLGRMAIHSGVNNAESNSGI